MSQHAELIARLDDLLDEYAREVRCETFNGNCKYRTSEKVRKEIDEAIAALQAEPAAEPVGEVITNRRERCGGRNVVDIIEAELYEPITLPVGAKLYAASPKAAEPVPMTDAKNRLLTGINYLRVAVENAEKKGTPKLAVLAEKPDGGKSIEVEFLATDFFADLAVVLDAPAITDRNRLAAKALKFVQEHGIKPKGE